MKVSGRGFGWHLVVLDRGLGTGDRRLISGTFQSCLHNWKPLLFEIRGLKCSTILPFRFVGSRMFQSRRALCILRRRSFSTKPLLLHPSRVLTSTIVGIKPCIRRNVGSDHQVRYKSTFDEHQIPPYIYSGDWVCGKCQAHNFHRRQLCFECQAVITDGRIFYKPGSWHCPVCNLSVQGF
jgi:hypothetical protein